MVIDIEDFKKVDHLYINKKFKKEPTKNEIDYIKELSKIDFYIHSKNKSLDKNNNLYSLLVIIFGALSFYNLIFISFTLIILYLTVIPNNKFDEERTVNKHKYTQVCQTLQKKYHVKPRKSRLNLIYRILLQKQIIETNESLEHCLIGKKSRINSGIQQISVLTTPHKFSCKHDCAFCPNFKNMPRSYIPNEPACRRATQNNFEPHLQFWDRATGYNMSGHPVDKVELIILGGTWDNYDWEYRKWFVKMLFYASNTFYDANKREPLSLLEEQRINETAVCKIIGLSIETRPDYANKPENILRYIELGATRLQFGMQTIYDDVLKLIKRGCKHKHSIEATKMLRESGYKNIMHIMPNLPYPDGYGGMYTSVEKDEEMFDYLINSDECRADEWKIYPTQIPKLDSGEEVYNHTQIEDWYNEGKYIPYSDEELIDLAVRLKKKLFNKNMIELRITRFIRDIPMGNIQGGASIPNMRQLVHKKLKEQCAICPCIRCSEIKDRKFDMNKTYINIKQFDASGGKEFFISKAIDIDGTTYRIGFVRLRLSKEAGMGFIDVLKNSALIRELHVYGSLHSTERQTDIIVSNSQHKGVGKELMSIAEKISKEHNFEKISVISGVGVRNYYRKLGYELDSGYMVKKLNTKSIGDLWICNKLSMLKVIMVIMVLRTVIKISMNIYMN